MPTPPTHVLDIAPSSGNFSTSGATKTSAVFNVQAGDAITLYASSGHNSLKFANLPVASGGSITWTPRITAEPGGSFSQMRGWSGAVGATANGITVSVSPSAGSGLEWGFTGMLWRSHGGIGNVVSENVNSEAPAIDIVCSANSAVDYHNVDWQALDGSARVWRTVNGQAITESFYYQNPNFHGIYDGYRLDVGAAGSKTFGLTAPTGQRPTHGAIEVLGTTGAPVDTTKFFQFL